MTANKGKFAESKVRDILKDIEASSASFTFNRCLDAHAAGGRFPAQPGDFQAFRLFLSTDSTINWLIEVKEVAREHRLGPRLPHGNFSPDSVARMLKREWAGSLPIVAICWRDPVIKKPLWTLSDLEQFKKREGGSWLVEGALLNPKQFEKELKDYLS